MKLQSIYIYRKSFVSIFPFYSARYVKVERDIYYIYIYIYIYMPVIIENIPSHKRKAEEVSTTPNTQCNVNNAIW